MTQFLAATFDIGDNLTSVLLSLLSLLGIIFAGGAAVQAKRSAEEVRRQTQPNGGSSLRDAIDRTERAASLAASAAASLHSRATGEHPPPVTPPPPARDLSGHDNG